MSDPNLTVGPRNVPQQPGKKLIVADALELALNPKTPREILEQLTQDGHQSWRIPGPDTPREVLKQFLKGLTTEQLAMYRQRAKNSNPNISKGVLEQLAKELPNKNIRPAK